jgi:hypothetical protein
MTNESYSTHPAIATGRRGNRESMEAHIALMAPYVLPYRARFRRHASSHEDGAAFWQDKATRLARWHRKNL